MPDSEHPPDGSLWERDDEVYEVRKVYDAFKRDGDELRPIVLVKVICVEPMPRHVEVERFHELYSPYDPETP
jgi:hypothetical protein